MFSFLHNDVAQPTVQVGIALQTYEVPGVEPNTMRTMRKLFVSVSETSFAQRFDQFVPGKAAAHNKIIKISVEGLLACYRKIWPNDNCTKTDYGMCVSPLKDTWYGTDVQNPLSKRPKPWTNWWNFGGVQGESASFECWDKHITRMGAHQDAQNVQYAAGKLLWCMTLRMLGFSCNAIHSRWYPCVGLVVVLCR